MKLLRKNVGILDYGVGNIASLSGALKKLGFQVTIGRNESAFGKVETLFLPGVGGFSYAMENLRKLKMDKFLKDRFDAQDLSVVGICLGMQILFDYSEEGDCEGLGLLRGQVKRFSDKECHVGWNIVNADSGSLVSQKSGFYFNHSYHVDCSKDLTIATSIYQKEFPVIVNKNRFYGVQFHPEKSQNIGAKLINTLVRES
ncbi:MAG: glutamine amidotransferase [Flavobacterium sp.]|jgi:glutamine amidotransferase